MIGGRDGARNFRMSNFCDGTDADTAFKFVPFGARTRYNTVKPIYDYFPAHPGYPGQQLALIPGTFVYDYSQTGQYVDPVAQAHLLEEFFNYANNANKSWTLPLGNNGVTQSFDGCPVWMITGGLYGTCCEGFTGLNDPAAGPIQAAWEAELSTPLVDPRRPAVQNFARTNDENSFLLYRRDGKRLSILV